MNFVKAAKMLISDAFTGKNLKSDCHHIGESAVRKSTQLGIHDDQWIRWAITI